MKPEKNNYNLELSHEMTEKINRQKILEEDIYQVIEHAERTGRRTLNTENRH
ncbi:MAG: hypothetical protein GX663_05245 [Clostridiales bacterium]|nr:hypothetical protein [Clostridiales bacterium]